MRQMRMTRLMLMLASLFVGQPARSNQIVAPAVDRFAGLGSLFPPPTEERGVDGRLGQRYWQQHIRYNFVASLDELTATIEARATLEYRNASPNQMHHLLFELAANGSERSSITQRSATADRARVDLHSLRAVRSGEEGNGGLDQLDIRMEGRQLSESVRGTRLMLDLDQPLAPSSTVRLDLRWTVRLVDADQQSSRSGFMKLPAGQQIFHVAQWSPQPVSYSDAEAWNTKPFVGAGKFLPELGDYEATLDVPRGLTVAATGTRGRRGLSTMLLTLQAWRTCAWDQRQDHNPAGRFA